MQIVNDPAKIQQMSGDYIDDVIVYPGNMLEVVGTVQMGMGRKIIVSKGAILKIEGQIITNLYKKCSNCEYKGETQLWFGIEVLGDVSKTQNMEHKAYCDHKLSKCFEYAYMDGRRVYSNPNPSDGGIIRFGQMVYEEVGIYDANGRAGSISWMSGVWASSRLWSVEL